MKTLVLAVLLLLSACAQLPTTHAEFAPACDCNDDSGDQGP